MWSICWEGPAAGGWRGRSGWAVLLGLQHKGMERWRGFTTPSWQS